MAYPRVPPTTSYGNLTKKIKRDWFGKGQWELLKIQKKGIAPIKNRCIKLFNLKIIGVTESVADISFKQPGTLKAENRVKRYKTCIYGSLVISFTA